MNLKDPKTANDVAKLAESLADRIEAAIGEPDRSAEYEAAALLLAPGAARVLTGKASGGTVSYRLIVSAKSEPYHIPLPWTGANRGMLRKDFATDIGSSIALAERVFDGWGWDVIKWPRGAGGVPAGVKVVDGVPGELPEGTFVYDAEVTPPTEYAATASGRVLVGQHTTAGGALLAAILRGYAFKVKHDAGMLTTPIDFDLTDEERDFVNDIVDRAEELELLPPAARIDRMMDIAAVHKGDCPLDLESFLHHATDFAFKHDFLGIVENIDRTTGKLRNEFVPKYAQAETDRIAAAGAKADVLIVDDLSAPEPTQEQREKIREYVAEFDTPKSEE